MVMKELNMANGEWLTVTADTSPSLSLSLSPVTKVRMIFLVSQLILIDQRGRVGKAREQLIASIVVSHTYHCHCCYLMMPLPPATTTTTIATIHHTTK